MTTPRPLLQVRSVFLVAGCAVAIAGYSVSSVLAANQPPAPVPSVSFEVKKNDLTLTKIAASKGTGGNTSSSTDTAQHNMRKAEVTYTISVRNTSLFPARNLAVEYHFYNKTTSTAVGAVPTLDDITSTENVDIDSGKTANITSQGIPYQDSQASTGSMAGRGGKGAKTSPPVIQTYVMGWHIDIRFNNKIIAHKDSPDNLQDLLKAYPKK